MVTPDSTPDPSRQLAVLAQNAAIADFHIGHLMGNATITDFIIARAMSNATNDDFKVVIHTKIYTFVTCLQRTYFKTQLLQILP